MMYFPDFDPGFFVLTEFCDKIGIDRIVVNKVVPKKINGEGFKEARVNSFSGIIFTLVMQGTASKDSHKDKSTIV